MSLEFGEILVTHLKERMTENMTIYQSGFEQGLIQGRRDLLPLLRALVAHYCPSEHAYDSELDARARKACAL